LNYFCTFATSNQKQNIMKQIAAILCFFALCAGTTFAQSGYPYTQVPFTAVKITPNTFWGDRIQAAREVTIPLAFSKCESEHRYKNFEMAAYTLQHPGHPGLQTPEWDVAKFMGFSFDDTDVYKTIEGASYVLSSQETGDRRQEKSTDSRLLDSRLLKQYIDSVLDVVAAAQEADGYLYTARTINPQHPHGWAANRRWAAEEHASHELYNLGHMVDAACAHYQATGSTKFLDIAKRYADCVVREVGPNPGQACVVPGHQIAEMALARLYVLTGEKKYLDEAKFLLDYRGKTPHKDVYSQSDKPVVDQTEAWGHAVRAGYMYAGMADVAALLGDSSYIKAIDTIYENIVSRKYYLTGGVGARHGGEAFGADYELPNLTAYNETCAAIAMVYLFERMFLLHGDAKYIDCLERTLYNGVISGMSVDGGKFFYPNPLSSDGRYRFNADGTMTRQPWFGCACCPSNLCRFIPSMPGYIYGVRDNDLYVNLFAANTATLALGGKSVTIQQETNYPWEGDIAIKVIQNKAKAFNMMIRIPGWVQSKVVPSDLYSYNDDIFSTYEITVNGQKVDSELENGYMVINRNWKKGDVVRIHFDMPVRTVVASPRVSDDRGRVAVERGPLVYCAEWADNDGINPHHLLLSRKPQFNVLPAYGIENQEGNGQTFSVTAISAQAQEASISDDGKLAAKDVTIKLIPYYAWNHRGAGKMDVWLARSLSGLED
jgi:hypothetical protein